MSGKVGWVALGLMLLVSGLRAQLATDVIGQHALGAGSSGGVKGMAPGSCQYCHAPHSGLDNGLWNQKLTTQTYTAYTSPTYAETGNSAVPSQTDTNLCLSCHDGTVAVGASIVYGQIATGKLLGQDTIATLQSSHPVSLTLPIRDAADLVASLSANGTTADPQKVKLVNGNIECTTCHNPHVEATDLQAKNFLVKDSSSGALCLACHDPNRVLNGVASGLAGWPQSIHATSTAAVQNLPYGTLASNACLNCHTDHNAAGAEWLQRGAGDQVCLNCHSASNQPAGTPRRAGAFAPRIVTLASAKSARLDVAAEYAKVGHPQFGGSRQRPVPGADPVRGPLPNRGPTSPNTPQQSGCIDCHNPHAVQSTTNFAAPPQVRLSQTRVTGLNQLNHATVLAPATAQYETCVRCHGPSRGKLASAKYGYSPLRSAVDGDARNLIPLISNLARSSHPIARNRSSALPQPSLLSHMQNLQGGGVSRAMGERIFCTDCHNSDDNREFGGNGPNGPHGSKWTHILERRYEFSQAVAPGQLITNLNPNPDLGSQGPYALCGKCHQLSNVMQNASFKKHSSHLRAGFSCSVCHTPHGRGSGADNPSGERMVNFDMKVVAPNGAIQVSYNRSSNTCTLTCHQVAHYPDGSVKSAAAAGGARK